MSVTTSVACTPNRMKIIFEFVRRRSSRGGISEEDLIEYLRPSSLSEGDMEPIRDTLNETKRLELISQIDGKYVVSETLADSKESFSVVVESRLLRPAEPDQFGHAEFQKALAYLMMKNPANPIDRAGPIRDMVSADCPDEDNSFELANSTRFINFSYWARYLGFARLLQHGSTTRVIPDPTAIVRQHIPTACASAASTDIHAVLVELSKLIPELDFGLVRSDVESRCKPDQSQAGDVSASLTLALMRLFQTKSIIVDNRTDAPGRLQLSPLTRLPGLANLSDLEVA